jgi:phage terminase Nu1 subunit (DNA packaging protein)
VLAVINRVDRKEVYPESVGGPLAVSVERYMSRFELAQLMGVSVATVDRMVAEGMPSVTWGRRTRRFRPSVAIGWAAERGRAA